MTTPSGTPTETGSAAVDAPPSLALREARDHRWSLKRRRRRLVRGVIGAVAALLGVGQAIAWANLAPGHQVLVYADGSYVSLPTADYHPFDGLALMAFAGAAIGLIVAISAWRVRAIRGAATLAMLGAGTVVGSAIAYGLGILLAGGTNPATVGATGHASIVVAGADPATWLVIVVEPFIAIAVYTFLAAWDGRTDLGVTRAASRLQDEADEGAEPVRDEHGGETAADVADDRPGER